MKHQKNQKNNYRWTVTLLVTLFLLGGSFFTACSQQQTQNDHLFEGQIAPLLEGMGDFHY